MTRARPVPRLSHWRRDGHAASAQPLRSWASVSNRANRPHEGQSGGRPAHVLTTVDSAETKAGVEPASTALQAAPSSLGHMAVSAYDWTRTSDHRPRKTVLYPLSYVGMVLVEFR